jgi:type II secretory pathway component PulF
VTVVGLLTLGGTSLHFGTSFLRFLKGAVDRVVLFLPVIGGLLRDGSVQQFALCTGLFLRSGATLAEATAASAEVERNSLLRRRLERMARVVAEGGRLSSAAREEGRFGDDALWFLETGDASGLLADHLLLAAVQYETKARLATRLAVRAVVPLFILLNGLVVLGAFTLIFIPMNDLLASFFKLRR